jgi:hypothetical protein
MFLQCSHCRWSHPPARCLASWIRISPTAFPPGSAEVSRMPAGVRRALVNFLYMGCSSDSKKSGHHADLCVTLFCRPAAFSSTDEESPCPLDIAPGPLDMGSTRLREARFGGRRKVVPFCAGRKKNHKAAKGTKTTGQSECSVRELMTLRVLRGLAVRALLNSRWTWGPSFTFRAPRGIAPAAPRFAPRRRRC